MDNIAPAWYGEAARSIAPFGMIMGIFMLVYSIWFGFAWGVPGWFAFGVTLLLALYLMMKSVKYMKHARLFPVNRSAEGRKIGKAMGILSGVSYGILWLAVILLLVLGLHEFIMPAVTLIIGIHFIPQARIFDRKLDYFVAPLPILSALIAFYYAFQTDMSWLAIFSIAGIGGALSTAIYGIYMIISYRSMAVENGIDIK